MTRIRNLLKYLLVAAIGNCSAAARADVAYEKVKEGDHDIEVVRLTVSPAAEPVPAFRHRLMARDVDLKTGNAVPFYYRAQAEMRTVMNNVRDKYDEDTEFGLWYGTGNG